mmetsp:Transcript_160058/g.292174  ORF Transcript_160058/g.292174 Transcript_160058/m.292174 type:complete len:222 (+) Transcript_160058:35-700(+)
MPPPSDCGDLAVIAGTVSAGASNFIGCSAVMHIINVIPAGIELYIGIKYLHDHCSKMTDPKSSTPLQWWLIVDGSVSLFLTTIGIVSLYLCGCVDKDALLYQMRKHRGNTEETTFVQDADMERLIQSQEAQRHKATQISGTCGCFPLFVYIFGWAFWANSSDASCSEMLRTSTFWVLIYRAVEYITFCCCCVPLFFACGLSHALADSMEADQAQEGNEGGE